MQRSSPVLCGQRHLHIVAEPCVSGTIFLLVPRRSWHTQIDANPPAAFQTSVPSAPVPRDIKDYDCLLTLSLLSQPSQHRTGPPLHQPTMFTNLWCDVNAFPTNQQGPETPTSFPIPWQPTFWPLAWFLWQPPPPAYSTNFSSFISGESPATNHENRGNRQRKTIRFKEQLEFDTQRAFSIESSDRARTNNHLYTIY